MAHIKWGTTRSYSSFPHNIRIRRASDEHAAIAWCLENTTGDFGCSRVLGAPPPIEGKERSPGTFYSSAANVVFVFDAGDDALRFKLIWG